MIIADIQLRWTEFLQNIHYRRSKRHTIRLTKVDLARERSISILQSRYGYSKEKAIFELDKYYSKALLY